MAPDTSAPPSSAPSAAPSRRALRARATSPHPPVEAAPVPAGPHALGWVDPAAVTAPPAPETFVVSSSAADPGADLLATAARRAPRRRGALVPGALALLIAAAYVAATLLWPLHAVAPEVEAVSVQPVVAPGATPAWPAAGGAALTVAGAGGILSSSADAVSIASITKIVTALVVLDAMPLDPGEQGPDFVFTAADRFRYWADRAAGESALDVPVGGTLTQYQMLEGLLIGSANNYADRLAGSLFPSDAVFADAALSWLSAHGISGVSIVDPSGIVSGNAATPEALIPLAAQALANPVIAEIVGKTEVDLPGAGHVKNTNALLADPGVVGLKTGTLDAYNLLAAKDVAVGATTVRVIGSVLGQPDRPTRDAAMRALFAQVELELQPQPSVPAGTLVGEVVTRWGDPVAVVTASDAEVVLWNGGTSTTSADFTLGDADDAGARVGTLTVAGPLDSTAVELRLAGDVEEPDGWWRLTHPFELFGLVP